MAKGGARPGAGRPKGSKTVPQFRDYVTEEQRVAFTRWALTNYKRNPRLATWVGDQIFGKAMQPIGGDKDHPLVIQGVQITVRR